MGATADKSISSFPLTLSSYTQALPDIPIQLRSLQNILSGFGDFGVTLAVNKRQMSVSNESNLTPKQLLFCIEYLVDLNATKAAVRAGYSRETAQQIGSENLSKPFIRTYIQNKMRERSDRILLDADFVMEGLKEVAQRCMQAKPVMRFDNLQMRMVQVKDDEDRDVWEFDSNGANKAFELIGKHIGVFEKDNRQKTPDAPDSDIVNAIVAKLS